MGPLIPLRLAHRLNILSHVQGFRPIRVNGPMACTTLMYRLLTEHGTGEPICINNSLDGIPVQVPYDCPSRSHRVSSRIHSELRPYMCVMLTVFLRTLRHVMPGYQFPSSTRFAGAFE